MFLGRGVFLVTSEHFGWGMSLHASKGKELLGFNETFGTYRGASCCG